mmetsp:Transcript_16068/g.19660  ORF Transcript_16068/g.19660 Transcript_16068/m.19660 type:complete len:283 (+) Transcript_16068:672-1520(+)|eukprot:CAMPEP_0197292686 /NCGR_PEP_ID=MMETSP0890-20130614/24540_1 /TAXON_ID=44058 ORGANISM="Aureoumbra lagunensis, Strain CCMP1510" /NCGR_SAMPLE_ID=MMETSP0890 /ASSEMBLY_ACC=CAM_ASM_000533 /LENGTH=282 /DNA_ID=CAMNT_0042766797 /DNA_START=626 /DNA_END=1474 /DNA_ORIENTATION=+
MTVSFHKFGEYFPGTGDVHDIGYDQGKNYAINFPLHDGMDDESFYSIFKPVISKVIQVFQPGAILMQCGADSLSGDRLGCFNLSIKGHAECVAFVRSLNIPMLVLGGGGYTLRNVPRVWTYETSVLLGTEIKDVLPYNDYFEYYGPDYRLHMPVSNMENLNSTEYLEHIKTQLFNVLKHVQPAPSVQITADPTIQGGGATGLPTAKLGAGMLAVSSTAQATSAATASIGGTSNQVHTTAMDITNDAVDENQKDADDDQKMADIRPSTDDQRAHAAEFYDNAD